MAKREPKQAEPELWDETQWDIEAPPDVVRRRRRQSVTFIALVFMVLGIGVYAIGVTQEWWRWPFTSHHLAIAKPQDCRNENSLPETKEITVTVLNANGRNNLAAETGKRLKDRGFIVTGVDNAPDKIGNAAEIRHSAKGLDEALRLASFIPNVVLVSDNRPNNTVTLVVSEGFTEVATTEQADQGIEDRLVTLCGPAKP